MNLADRDKWVEHHFSMFAENDITTREFGTSYVQRRRRLSFNQAKDVLDLALEKGVIEDLDEGLYRFKKLR